MLNYNVVKNTAATGTYLEIQRSEPLRECTNIIRDTMRENFVPVCPLA
jgi:hypothetical protein